MIYGSAKLEQNYQMIEAKLSPFLQRAAYGNAEIVTERRVPIVEAAEARESLLRLRLRVATVLGDQGYYRKDEELIKDWTSPLHNTPLPFRLDRTNEAVMRELKQYYEARKTVKIGSRELEIVLYSLGPDSPKDSRTVMITVPTIAYSRGILVLTRRGDPITSDTHGRLLKMHRILPKWPALIFIRFATPTDEDDLGGLVSPFEQTGRSLLPSSFVSRTIRFEERLRRGGFQLGPGGPVTS